MNMHSFDRKTDKLSDDGENVVSELSDCSLCYQDRGALVIWLIYFGRTREMQPGNFL